jgi:hypothetical protein
MRIVRSGTETLSEISRLLIPTGVMPCVIGYVARDISLDELEFGLREAGIEIELFETFKLDEDSNGSALMGWQLSGRKK